MEMLWLMQKTNKDKDMLRKIKNKVTERDYRTAAKLQNSFMLFVYTHHASHLKEIITH